MTKLGELPVEKEIIPPEEGWVENCYYIVKCSMNKNNPVFSALFFSGFLNGKEGGPGAYNVILAPDIDSRFEIGQLYYLEVVQEMGTKSEMEFLCDEKYEIFNDFVSTPLHPEIKGH